MGNSFRFLVVFITTDKARSFVNFDLSRPRVSVTVRRIRLPKLPFHNRDLQRVRSLSLLPDISENNSGLQPTPVNGAGVDSDVTSSRPSLSDVEAVFREIDKDGSGDVDFKEFYSW
jgi:hypothetical protein